MPRGIYTRTPRSAASVKAVATCRYCSWAWQPKSGFIVERCPRCDREKDVRIRPQCAHKIDTLKSWRAARPGYSTEANKRVRKTALLLIGRGVVECIRCHCDRPELLEINHKNGGGQRDLRGRSQQFYRDIALLKRPIDDLELLCKPCNAVHALELQHGALPFKVQWESK